MSKKPARVQFNGGELSPWLEGRTDIAKYEKTARLCRNFIPIAEGSLKRRGGTRFVAQTPTEADLVFMVTPEPAEATVLIEGIERQRIYVSRGDTVRYEVRAAGYVSAVGQVTVVQSTELVVRLVSQTEHYKLTIVPNPADAVVKIGGYVRSSYEGMKNETVNYSVNRNGYLMKSGTVMLNGDKTLQVTLQQEESNNGSYGDWGRPVAFISCTAYGCYEVQEKCFILRFENGYLPILFPAVYKAPRDSDILEERFVYCQDDGYDSYCRGKHDDFLSCISREANVIWYRDLDGTVIFPAVFLMMMVGGWQLDEDGMYASIYSRYDGSVSGSIIRVYYDGDLVWTMKGRKNV